MADAARRFVVVLRGPSIARVPEGEEIAIERFPTEVGPVKVTFRTHFIDEGHEAPIPRGLFAEAESAAPNVDSAITAAMNATMALKCFLSIAANASVGDFEFELAFDDTPGRLDHEYVQQAVPIARGLPQPGRRLRVDATRKMVQAIASHARLDRLHRAIVHYDLALRYWRREFSVLVLSHLWVAVEALTGVARERLKREFNVSTEQEIADRWGIEKKALDPEIRKRVIFHEDAETYRRALRASDAFEHSFESFQWIWARAVEINESLARHVRAAILELGDVPAPAREELLRTPFDRAFESIPLSRRLRGVLHGVAGQLAAPDQLYPMMRWESKIDKFKRDGSRYTMTPSETIKPVWAEGVTLTDQRIEIWGPKLDIPDEPSPPPQGQGVEIKDE